MQGKRQENTWKTEVCAGITKGTVWTEEGMKVNHMIDYSLSQHTLLTIFCKFLPYTVTHCFAAAVVAIEM